MTELSNEFKSLFKNISIYEKLSQLSGKVTYAFYRLYDEIYILHNPVKLYYNNWLTKGYIIAIDKTKQDVKVLFDGYFPERINIYSNNDKEYVLMGWTSDLETLIIKLKGNTCSLEPYKNDEFDRFIKKLFEKETAKYLSLGFSKDKFVLLHHKPRERTYYSDVILVYCQNENEKHKISSQATFTEINEFLQGKKTENAFSCHVGQKLIIQTLKEIHKECYFIGTDEDGNGYCVAVDRENLSLLLLKIDWKEKKCKKLQSFDLKNAYSFNLQIYKSAKRYRSINEPIRKEEDLPVLQINDEYYIFNANDKKLIKLDIPTFQNICVLQTKVQTNDLYLIEIEEENRRRYDFYYRTEHFTFYGDKNVDYRFQLVQIPGWDKELLCVRNKNGEIKNWYILDHTENQVNVKCFDGNITKQDIIAKEIARYIEWESMYYSSQLLHSRMEVEILDPDIVIRLYHRYRLTQPLSIFAKKLFQPTKDQEKTNNLKI